MIVHQVYAQIHEQTVKNIMVCDNYEIANYITRATYGDEAFAVDCLQYACSVGDTYRDGIFYREDGSVIDPLPTQEQQVQDLTHESTALQLALTEQYETNLTLETEVTRTQLALIEIYEGMEV